MSAVVAGAGPAHALYFATYEHLKETIQPKTSQPLYLGEYLIQSSNTCSTLLWEMISFRVLSSIFNATKNILLIFASIFDIQVN